MKLPPPTADTTPIRNAEMQPEKCSVSPLVAAVKDAHARLSMIRSFFLEPQPTYTFADLARLWQVPVTVVQDIYEERCVSQLAGTDSAQGLHVPSDDAVGTTISFNLLRPYDVERALDAEFTKIRSDEWKTVPLLIRLPRFALHTVAARASLCSDPSASVQIEHFIVEVLLDEKRRCRS